MTEELDKLEEILNSYEQDKSNLMDKLIERMFSSDNETFISNIGSFLIDNFRDEKIEQCILSLINEPTWKGSRGVLLFLLGEYTNDQKYMYFIIDLFMNNLHEDNGVVFMEACSMIFEMKQPFNKKDIMKSLERLEQEKPKVTDERSLGVIESLTDYLNAQIEIADFYAEFQLEKEKLMGV